MKKFLFTVDNINGLRFGAKLLTPNEFNENNDEGIVEDSPFEIPDLFVTGPLLTDSCQKLEYSCDVEDGGVEVGIIDEVRTFNTNKEIMGSDFFTKDQAEYVKKNVKSAIAKYYKVWASSFKSSDKKLFEVEERGFGSMNAYLDFKGPFNKDNLFFLLADKLPCKETIIAEVGYKNPDGTITSASFEYDSYTWNDPVVNYDDEEY